MSKKHSGVRFHYALWKLKKGLTLGCKMKQKLPQFIKTQKRSSCCLIKSVTSFHGFWKIFCLRCHFLFLLATWNRNISCILRCTILSIMQCFRVVSHKKSWMKLRKKYLLLLIKEPILNCFQNYNTETCLKLFGKSNTDWSMISLRNLLFASSFYQLKLEWLYYIQR